MASITWEMEHVTTDGTQQHAFTLMTWNVLADGLAQHGDFVTDASLLTWPHRSELIVARIAAVRPDILVVQELNHFPWLAAQLHEYYPVYVPKPTSAAVYNCGSTGEFPPDGLGLFVRRSRFRVLQAQPLYYSSEEHGDGPTGIDNQAAILLLLRDITNGRSLIVSTTHLKAKGGQANEATRLRHLGQWSTQLEGMMDGLRAKGHDMNLPIPVIMCGDFNSGPCAGPSAPGQACPEQGHEGYGPVYHFMTRHRLAFRSVYNKTTVLGSTLASDTAGDGLSSSSHATPPSTEGTTAGAPSACHGAHEPSFTTWKWRMGKDGSRSEKKHAIDYIWLSQGASGARACLAVVDRLALPGTDDIGPQALPTKDFPSDHMHLAARFQWLG